jgi:hypothetical protein
MVRPVQAGSVKPRRPVSTPGRTPISENLPASRKDKEYGICIYSRRGQGHSGASVEFKGNGLDLLDLTIQIVGSVVAEVPEPLRPYVIKKIQDKIPDAVQNDLEAQGKAAPAEKKEKPPVGETVGFRMARQFAETEPGFKDFIVALANKLQNG